MHVKKKIIKFQKVPLETATEACDEIHEIYETMGESWRRKIPRQQAH